MLSVDGRIYLDECCVEYVYCNLCDNITVMYAVICVVQYVNETFLISTDHKEGIYRCQLKKLLQLQHPIIQVLFLITLNRV